MSYDSGAARIHPSARKHGVSEADIEHALRHVLRGFEIGANDVHILIGPARSGTLLEVGVINRAGLRVVVHAMRARPRFLWGWLET